MPEATCHLCSLPAGPRPIAREGHTFCCWGCFHVWSVISELAPTFDASDFREHPVFREAQRAGWLRADGASSPTGGATDEPPAGGSPPPDEDDSSARSPCRTYQGQIGRLMCPSCGWLVRHLAGRIEGVWGVQVDFLTDLMRFSYDPTTTDPAVVGRELARFGYELSDTPGDEPSGRPLVEFGAALFFTGNLMALSFISYVGLFEELDPMGRRAVPWLLAALAAPVVFYCGRSILVRGWIGLRHGKPVMESLLALGSFTAFAASMANLLRGSYHYYFDAAAVIVTLALFGRLVETRYKRNASFVLRNMASLLPAKARGADGRFRPVASFEPGDRIRVERDETVPLDGRLVDGEGWCSETHLTGEPRPVHKTIACDVFAGSTLTNGAIELELTATSETSTLNQVLQRVREGLLEPRDWSRMANRIAAGFFPVVIGLSLVALAVGSSRAGFSEGVSRMIAVLVVACPCALGLATPVVILRAFSLLSRRGIVLSDFSVLERLRRIRHVCLDKTGTLTRGVFQLDGMANWAGDGRQTALQWAASLETTARHPIAAALLDEARRAEIRLLPAEQVQEVPGRGVEGRVSGRPVRVGSRTWFVADRWTFPDEAASLESLDGSVAYWGFDGTVRGGFAFADPPRSQSGPIVAQLHALGYQTSLLSGDRLSTTRDMARQLGIPTVAADLTPRAKADYLRDLGHPVIMVGDGVNDAPALAAADVGVAVGSASLIAQEVAAVTLLGTGPERLPDLFLVAKKANRILRQNLAWAFGYNAVALVLATSGALHPIVAAAAMATSSITVLANTLRVTAR